MKKGKGPPLIKIDPKVVEAMAGVGATDQEIADFCGCAASTITSRFRGILTKSRSTMRTRLRQVQFKLAIAGNPTMCIWLGKQMLDQSDQSTFKISDLTSLTDEQLEALAAGKAPKP